QELSTLGFECTLEEVDLEDITKNRVNTITACTSAEPGVKSQTYLDFLIITLFAGFSQRKCLEGIYEDLNVYRAELKNFNDQKMLATIDKMMKVSFS
ncbi:IL12A protein, partial [Todus mexicanus]|nr:IL12A protein [Todus mexicanus]